MKNEKMAKLFALLALVGLMGVAPVWAEEDEEDEDKTPLAEQMETVSGSLKRLRKAEGFEAKAELVRKAQAACIKSLQFQPALLKDMKDPKAKAMAEAGFKRLMGLTLAGLGELELAFLNEDEDEADAVIDKLKDLKKEGHQRPFKEKD